MYYGYYDYSPYDMRQNTRIISDLEKAINGEYSAIQCYEKLAKEQKLLRQKKSFKKYARMKSDTINYLQSYIIL